MQRLKKKLHFAIGACIRKTIPAHIKCATVKKHAEQRKKKHLSDSTNYVCECSS